MGVNRVYRDGDRNLISTGLVDAFPPPASAGSIWCSLLTWIACLIQLPRQLRRPWMEAERRSVSFQTRPVSISSGGDQSRQTWGLNPEMADEDNHALEVDATQAKAAFAS